MVHLSYPIPLFINHCHISTTSMNYNLHNSLNKRTLKNYLKWLQFCGEHFLGFKILSYVEKCYNTHINTHIPSLCLKPTTLL